MERIKIIAENITALNSSGSGLSWKERYDYSIRMIMSLFKTSTADGVCLDTLVLDEAKKISK